MPFEWERTEEGSKLSSIAVRGDLSGIADEINDLPETSIQPRSLGQQHLPSMVDVSAKTSCGASSHHYENVYPGWNVDTMVSIGKWTNTGWVVIGQDRDSTGVPQLTVSHSGFGPASTPGGVYIIMANIQMAHLFQNHITLSSDTDIKVDHYGVFKLQVATSDGQWHSIKTSERYASASTNDGASGNGTGLSLANSTGDHYVPCQKDIAIREMVTDGMMAGWGNKTIVGARVLVSLAGFYAGFGSGNHTTLRLQRCNLSVFGLYGERIA